MRWNATTNCSVVFARMASRLAERLRGFRTQGNSTPRAASTGFSPRAMRLNRGTGTPAAARHWGIWNLSRAAATAAGALARSPRRSAMAAAAAVVTSSTPTTAASGRTALHSAARAAASAASTKSRVSRLSGASASSVLGFSEAHTRSTPSVCAASMKSSVRYVRVGRSSSSRALPPTAGSGLAGGVGGVGALRVIGRVEHLADLGKLFFDQALDARLERDVRRAAALAAAAHGQVDPVVLNVDQLDEAPVSRDGGVDHRVDQLLHAGLEVGRGLLAHVITSQTGTVPSFPARANWPSRGSAQQNQGSLSRGGRRRSDASPTAAGAGAPAAAAASARTRSKASAAYSRRSAAAATTAATSAWSASTRGSGCVHS